MRLLGFRPEIGAAGDAMPFYWDGAWHLFFLATPEGVWDPPERVSCRLAHIVSTNLVDWVQFPDALVPGRKGSVDGDGIWTGSLIEHNGRFHFFYTGYNHEATFQQTICRATSDDLIIWTKDPTNPQIRSDVRWYEAADWRDPFVYYDTDAGLYTMLIAARELNGPIDRRGCIAVAYSTDLNDWTIEGPLWTPRQTRVMECPEYFSLGDYQYLVFSCFSGNAKTHYRIVSPDGHWEARPLESLDGSKFYAAKSASDGNRRITFAWIPERAHGDPQELFTWGGEFGSPRQVVPLPDGSLTCRLPKEIIDSYTRCQEFVFSAGDGRWKQRDDGLYCDARGTYGFGLISTERRDLMLETEVHIQANTMAAGILLEPETNMSSGHVLMIEPDRHRVSIQRWPIKWESFWQRFMPGSPTLGLDMEQAALVDQWLPVRPRNRVYPIRILRRGQLVECYVDDQVSLTYRIYGRSESMFGLFVDQGAANFASVSIKS